MALPNDFAATSGPSTPRPASSRDRRFAATTNCRIARRFSRSLAPHRGLIGVHLPLLRCGFRPVPSRMAPLVAGFARSYVLYFAVSRYVGMGRCFSFLRDLRLLHSLKLS